LLSQTKNGFIKQTNKPNKQETKNDECCLLLITDRCVCEQFHSNFVAS